MYVCVCNAVTEHHIAQAVEQGARRLRDLRASLGVAAECGRCASCAHSCLRMTLDDSTAQCAAGDPGAYSLAMEA
jgi:bacterioferritin-associated ferredoxin